MKSAITRMICRLLVFSLLVLPFQAQAGLIGTGQAASATGQVDRTAVLSLVNRADVAGQLQAMGLDPRAAGERIAAMTDNEVRSLAGKVDSLPAGAKSSGWAWALVIVLAVVLYYNWK